MPFDPIVDDVFQNRRDFLPGAEPTPEEVQKHFDGSILIDGLTKEESKLVLSALPRGSHRIYLNPLDKGLSEAKVYAGRYEANGTMTKPYVFKIGPLKKIEQESSNIERLVRPTLLGIEKPIFRGGLTKGLVIQPIAGLKPTSRLQSLKDFARTSEREVVTDLLSNRLALWYEGHLDTQVKSKPLGSIFTWYLSKLGSVDPYPPDWNDLKIWVRDLTGCPWHDDLPSIISALKNYSLSYRPSVIHGDLHSQNVLVDELRNSWPIDFYWCTEDTTPLLDLAMLECSLKFLAIHQRSELRSVIAGVENLLAREPVPSIALGDIPYRSEIQNVLQSVLAVRRYAFQSLNVQFEEYRKVLCLMTYVHSTHPLLNRPFVLASLQIQSALQHDSM